MTMPPEDVTPFNIAGIRFLEIESISVNEWHPLPDGQGRPEQVHLWITLRGVTEPLSPSARERWYSADRFTDSLESIQRLPA